MSDELEVIEKKIEKAPDLTELDLVTIHKMIKAYRGIMSLGAAANECTNADILAKIERLERKERRATRELLIDPTHTQARNFLVNSNNKIIVLRAQIV